MPDRFYRDTPEYRAAARTRRLKFAAALVAAVVLGFGVGLAVFFGWAALR